MIDIYQRRSSLKFFLGVMGALILLITLFYSNYLAESLRKSEEKNSMLYKEAFDFLLNDENLNCDVSFQNYVTNSYSLPIIIKNDIGDLVGENFGDKNQDSLFLRRKVDQFLSQGKKPLKSAVGGYVNEIYFFNSELLDYIRYFPLVQLLLIALFIGLGYYLFNSSRKAEQNRVWVGMAKETAHQLGTPISAIIAWLIHLKENTALDEDQEMIVSELQNDINRLELVADRFSKIGSKPELTTTDLVVEIERMKKYMSNRAARHVQFNFESNDSGKYFADINAHLFDWVIENLMRNSLDSMDGAGTLSTKVFKEDNFIHIEVSDTGKGIDSGKFKTIFQPGFSTKKRGWGLGLSLSKRIIEEYHGGKIYVKESRPHEITTFVIKLKEANHTTQ